MDKMVSSTNLSFAKQTISYISDKLKFRESRQALWVVFGSYVINMNTPDSDLDIIAVHDIFTKSDRSIYKFKNIPIHFTKINMRVLENDGERRLYGSYFTGKIINPHIFLYGNKKLEDKALYHAGKFIAPLAGFLGRLTGLQVLTASQVTSLVFIAYLSTDPSFDSYFLNYFVSPDFKNIWSALCKSTIKMLNISNSLVSLEDKHFFKVKFPNYKTFHSERMKISARHWSYGAACHGGNYRFQDMIFTKAEEKMKKIAPSGKKYKDMLTFLKKQSGLSEIYI
jgi:predicted nucleotidyltransferase